MVHTDGFLSQGGNNMKFIREIGLNNINDVVINKLDQEGFTLIWKEESIEVWCEMSPTEKAGQYV